MYLTSSRAVGQFLGLLKQEADAIMLTAERLEHDQVESALKLLEAHQGKVVLTGVGKSGIVAKKIAATLTSIGTFAVYLHPCDALHGDLGVVMNSDVAILFSNSGETDELVQMLPHLKNRKVPIIAIVGNCDSTLAKNADAVLDTSVNREACPLNLAPTTSTTVALAVGDALAMTVMQIRGITPEAFAVNHPAGRLGKRLTLQVKDLMWRDDDNPMLSAGASWLEVVAAITQGGAGAVSIVESDGRLLGVITDGDLRRWLQKTSASQLESLRADKVMTASPVAVEPSTLAYDALMLMEERSSQISVLPVVESSGHCVGLLRLHDLLRTGL